MKKICFIILFPFLVHATDIDFKGFLTFAYKKSDSPESYLDGLTDDGEFGRGTKAGMQMYSELSRKVDVFVQFLSDGDEGRDFNFALDIAHVTYNMNNNHKVLYGKIRLPVWLISDYEQVGALYPWVSPPDEVYSLAPLEDIGANNTFFGISFEGLLFNHGFSQIGYRFYTGGSEQVTEREGGPGSDIEIRIKGLSGLVLDYTYRNFYLKLSHLNVLSEGEKFDFENEVYFEPKEFSTRYSTAGLKFDNDQFLFMTEYSYVNSDTVDLELVKSYYATIGAYFGDSYLIHYTYSEVPEDNNTNRDFAQTSQTLGLNINLDLSTVFKIEARTISVAEEPVIKGDGFRSSGFFEEHPDRDVAIYALSINTMF